MSVDRVPSNHVFATPGRRVPLDRGGPEPGAVAVHRRAGRDRPRRAFGRLGPRVFGWVFGLGLAFSVPIHSAQAERGAKRAARRERAAAAGSVVASVEPDARGSRAQAAVDRSDRRPAARRTARRGNARRNRLWLTIDLYRDSGTDDGRTKVGALDRERFDVDGTVGPALGLSLGYLHAFSDLVAAGGTLRYLGTYEYEPDGDGETTELGTLIELGGRMELDFTVTPDLHAFAAGELGLGVLLPSGALDDNLTTLSDQGYSVWDTPRLGVLLGPEVGARYRVEPWLWLRGGLSLLYGYFLLYDAEAEGGSATAERDYSLTRLRLSAGAELLF